MPTIKTAGPYFSASIATGAKTPRTSLSLWASVLPPRKLPIGSTTISLQSGSFTRAASMAFHVGQRYHAVMLASIVNTSHGRE